MQKPVRQTVWIEKDINVNVNTNCKECADRRSKKGDEMCKSFNSIYSGEKRDLLLRKGVHPYDWVDSIEKFSETQLPSQESFYSKL